MSLWNELKRRNVVRVGVAYVVVAWLVLQVADVILNNIEAPQWIFQVILLALALGLPVALIFAWAFELTPDGLKREHEVDRSKFVANSTGRKLNFVIIAMLVIALTYLGYDKLILSTERNAALVEATTQSMTESDVFDETDKSIAVLPFANLTGDIEQEYFSDGLAEELLNLLARIPVLRVIARTSSFSYKGKNTNIAEVSRELNVSHVLQGSVRSFDDTTRVSVQLIRARDSSQLWSKTYERTLDNVFLIQDEIAAAVVKELELRLLGSVPKARQTDPKAYALYLQGRELGRQSTAAGHEQSNELYRQALDLAPDFTAAWAGLAENYIFLADRSLMPIDEGFAQARGAAKKALEFDRDFAPALASLGWIAMVHDNDLAQAARHLERALELDPANPRILRPAATLSTNLVRLDDAIALLEYGVIRDPVSSSVYANLGLSYFCAGRLDEAISAYRTALSLAPEAIGLQSFIGEVLLAKKEPEAALAAMQREPSEAWRLLGLVMAHHALGNSTQSDSTLKELIKIYGEEWPYNIAYVFAFRGDADDAFEWLEKARQYNDPGLSEVASAPEFNNIRSDPRWLPLLHGIGKAPAQLDAVDFDVSTLAKNTVE